MFTFGFSDEIGPKSVISNKQTNSNLTWNSAAQILVDEHLFSREFNDEEYSTVRITDDLELKFIKSENLAVKLAHDPYNGIIQAESQHSDLLPAVYEGGLKVWECTYDLAQYLLRENVPLGKLKVLDLGCGAGILGIIALLKGSVAHFQDYNQEVIELVTMPNVLLNLEKKDLISQNTEFYFGDWAEFSNLLNGYSTKREDKYNVILSSETIYNPDNHRKLLDVFKLHLAKTGVGYISGKTYYFGVGGGMRQFEALIHSENDFNVENVWKSHEGVQREIIKLTWKQT